MKKPTNKWSAIIAIACALAGFNGSASAQIATNPVIICHPQSLAIQMDNEAKFTVSAVNPTPPHVLQTLMYQWQVRGPGQNNFVDITNATSDTLTFTHVTTNDVAYYRVKVTGHTNATTTSEAAQLLVWTTNSPLLVYGSPVVSAGDMAVGDCFTTYVGYVSYNIPSVWWQCTGGLVNGTKHRAKDDNGTDTLVVAVGSVDDLRCSLSPLDITHTGPPATGQNNEDPRYYFGIYFTQNSNPSSVPTFPYPLRLIGFKPWP
jgi:hypothetical protein